MIEWHTMFKVEELDALCTLMLLIYRCMVFSI